MAEPVKCLSCGELARHYAKGMCEACWRRMYQRIWASRNKAKRRLYARRCNWKRRLAAKGKAPAGTLEALSNV